MKRTIAIRRLRGCGIGGIALGLFLIVSSAVYLTLIEQPFSSRWTNFVVGAGLMVVGYMHLRNAKRQLADLERERVVSARSDGELRSGNGL